MSLPLPRSQVWEEVRSLPFLLIGMKTSCPAEQKAWIQGKEQGGGALQPRDGNCQDKAVFPVFPLIAGIILSSSLPPFLLILCWLFLFPLQTNSLRGRWRKALKGAAAGDTVYLNEMVSDAFQLLAPGSKSNISIPERWLNELLDICSLHEIPLSLSLRILSSFEAPLEHTVLTCSFQWVYSGMLHVTVKT